MGNHFFNKKIGIDEYPTNYLSIKYKNKLKYKCKVQLQFFMSQYTLTTFPDIPIITQESNEICYNTWNKIINTDITNADGVILQGKVAFYNEFYGVLKIVDTCGIIDGVLLENSKIQDNELTKMSILLRIVKNIINIKNDSEKTQKKLYMLGNFHSTKHIKPFFYSIFVKTLLQSIYVLLGVSSTEEIMDAWINQIAFVMKYMTIPIAETQIKETILFKNNCILQKYVNSEKFKNIYNNNYGFI